MGYREVTVLELKEVLRLWLSGMGKKRIAAQLGLDVKTVRRYVRVAEGCGLTRASQRITDEQLAEVSAGLRVPHERPHGDSWELCSRERAFIAQQLLHHLKLSKVRRLLLRRGVDIPYPTLHRFAVAELDFGRTAPTIPVADCEPGEEVQLDTGWMTLLEPDLFGKRRRFRAWIFTAVRSRHRYVHVCFGETTRTAIAACEAAWQFFGGIFHVLVVDNTKSIVQTADPLAPRITAAFLEYAQARGFHIDTARVRSPRDKARETKPASSARCSLSATTASPASGCTLSSRRRTTPIIGAQTSMVVAAIRVRSACRSSSSRQRRKPRSCRRRPRRTRSRSGASRSSLVTSARRSRALSTRCPRASSASGCALAPTRARCVSTRARRSSRRMRAKCRAASRSTRATTPSTRPRTRCATSRSSSSKRASTANRSVTSRTR